jgi:hypothetical protein
LLFFHFIGERSIGRPSCSNFGSPSGNSLSRYDLPVRKSLKALLLSIYSTLFAPLQMCHRPRLETSALLLCSVSPPPDFGEDICQIFRGWPYVWLPPPLPGLRRTWTPSSPPISPCPAQTHAVYRREDRALRCSLNEQGAGETTARVRMNGVIADAGLDVELERMGRTGLE